MMDTRASCFNSPEEELRDLRRPFAISHLVRELERLRRIQDVLLPLFEQRDDEESWLLYRRLSKRLPPIQEHDEEESEDEPYEEQQAENQQQPQENGANETRNRFLRRQG
ncbi:hypothetical protein O3M35_004663 [Rhynocoris fuscipes]|uniref:Uncharacterized protein n=1 Tax=Rhynocoris fuscipes TaxID=488301 RepID=A0AAW1CIP7_9HEMI